MKTEIKTREELKALVSAALELPKVQDGDLFIAGVTKVKDYKGAHQMQLEIVQKKNLRGGKTNLLQVLNIGDERFRASVGSRRVWLKITEKGFDSIFQPLTERPDGKDLTGAQLVEETAQLVGKQVLAVFTKIKEIMVDGKLERPTISVKQYSSEEGLPARIQKIMDLDPDSRSEADEAEIENLAMQTAEGDPLVDKFGNQVFEINEFTYGEDANIIIPKMTLSDYNKQKASVKKTEEATSAGILADLVE